ncbi:hypothetical protein [Pseudonocardia sp. KRD291]|uniref:hypothetical protein n=1 Tax=Pseudonocardia sp. KRD291 TaxID=2792007 RepID=UPI001C49F593|nr:hypothetical protein [Pseudonocardia sp. KRD291]MBW0101400.1 hypothetical protein [Pseudonocardia sp. KRD291]
MDLAAMSVDELVSAVQHSEQLRRAGRENSGRLLAELHSREGLSWPAIARLTEIRQTTAYDLARPFLDVTSGDDDPSE